MRPLMMRSAALEEKLEKAGQGHGGKCHQFPEASGDYGRERNTQQKLDEKWTDGCI